MEGGSQLNQLLNLPEAAVVFVRGILIFLCSHFVGSRRHLGFEGYLVGFQQQVGLGGYSAANGRYAE